MVFEPVKVAVASFTDPRAVALAEERERHNRESHNNLIAHLSSRGFQVLDVATAVGLEGTVGLRRPQEVRAAINAVRAGGADCLIIGCWRWTEPMLAVNLVRALNVPTLLFAHSHLYATGLGLMSAMGSALWEVGPNEAALRHARVRDDYGRVEAWVRGVGALQRMRRGSLLLWGGTYCLRMDHLQDDTPKLKSFLVGDILNESEYLLVRRADNIIADQPGRIEHFLQWLQQHGASISYDERMCTPESLRRQIALYLAARDRLRELEAEDIIGVSVHCQPALSMEYGVTGCLLPAFLPFPEDDAGAQPIMNAVCEGDIKGLISTVLLSLLRPGTPALFGDIREIEEQPGGRRLLSISNCGAHSVYYARNSGKAAEALPRVRIRGQCQGASGAAVGYYGVESKVTIARLTRVAGEYRLLAEEGHSVNVTEEMVEPLRWGSMWPVCVVDVGLDMDRFYEIVGSNHFSLIPDHCIAELEYFAGQAGIPVVRLRGVGSRE